MFPGDLAAPDRDHGDEDDADFAVRGRDVGQEPGDLLRVAEGEEEFVDEAVCADGAGEEAELEGGRGVGEEFFRVELVQGLSS